MAALASIDEATRSRCSCQEQRADALLGLVFFIGSAVELGGLDSRPEYIGVAVEGSLRRLRRSVGWVPIPGTTKLHRLEENLAGAGLALSPAEVQELGSAASKIEVRGAR